MCFSACLFAGVIGPEVSFLRLIISMFSSFVLAPSLAPLVLRAGFTIMIVGFSAEDNRNFANACLGFAEAFMPALIEAHAVRLMPCSHVAAFTLGLSCGPMLHWHWDYF